jgi:hypothetical protein
MSRQQPEITQLPRNVAVFLGIITMLLVFLHLAVNLADKNFSQSLVRLFSLNVEKNVPSFFTTCLWLINAMLFLMIWKTRSDQHGRRWTWLLLAWLFCFFAIDEYFSMHEPLAPYLRSVLHASGIFYYAWIIPYGIGVMGLAWCVVPVLWKLDNRARFWFIAAAITFISGSIGLEMMEGWYFEMVKQKDDIYFIMMSVEESMEMIGLVMLVYASLLLLEKKQEGSSVYSTDPDRRS